MQRRHARKRRLQCAHHRPYTLKSKQAKVMSTAFEITSEDVRSVMEINGRPVDEATAEKLLHDVIAPEDGRIEKAALYGNEMEEQTEYAYQELAKILREAGVLT
jgi:hypothetical protein